MVILLPEEYTFESLSINDAQLVQSRIRMRIHTLEAQEKITASDRAVLEELARLELAFSVHVNNEIARQETARKLHEAVSKDQRKIIDADNHGSLLNDSFR
jgi:hypothetical protein